MDSALYETYETRWLSTSGKVHRRQAHWIELQLIGRRDAFSAQGDLYAALQLAAAC